MHLRGGIFRRSYCLHFLSYFEALRQKWKVHRHFVFAKEGMVLYDKISWTAALQIHVDIDLHCSDEQMLSLFAFLSLGQNLYLL